MRGEDLDLLLELAVGPVQALRLHHLDALGDARGDGRQGRQHAEAEGVVRDARELGRGGEERGQGRGQVGVAVEEGVEAVGGGEEGEGPVDCGGVDGVTMMMERARSV